MVKTILYKRTIALGKSTDFRKDVRRSEPRGDSGGSVPVSVLSVSVCLRVCVPVSVLSAAFSLCEFVDPVIVTRVVAELVGE